MAVAVLEGRWGLPVSAADAGDQDGASDLRGCVADRSPRAVAKAVVRRCVVVTGATVETRDARKVALRGCVAVMTTIVVDTKAVPRWIAADVVRVDLRG